jgi:hypothetical protein
MVFQHAIAVFEVLPKSICASDNDIVTSAKDIFLKKSDTRNLRCKILNFSTTSLYLQLHFYLNRIISTMFFRKFFLLFISNAVWVMISRTFLHVQWHALHSVCIILQEKISSVLRIYLLRTVRLAARIKTVHARRGKVLTGPGPFFVITILVITIWPHKCPLRIANLHSVDMTA